MVFLKKQTFIVLAFAIIFSKSSAQEAQSDSAFLQNALSQTVDNFNTAMGEQARLYNGHEYLPYDRSIQGNALYPPAAKSLETGEITYDGFVYKKVPMMYDIYKDAVVVLLYNKFSMFSLLSERVSDFTLLGHHFVRVDADTLKDDKSGMTTGFYDQLYGGKTEVLAKRTKTIQNSTNSAIILETYFIEKNEYYVRKGKTYYKVGGKGSFLNVLKDKKALLQRYMKDQQIDYRANPELAMAQLAAYYDQH
ncbi:MAG: hypothetical protein JST19_11770 [Bacteroidetes bacterium]|nr:hypothetical protein [Bacteroidota bacterium]